MTKKIKTNFHEIGDNCPCYIVAEIGSNHNGNYDIACEMIDKAKDAGANAVKFQTFKAQNHYSKFAEKISLYNESVYDLIESLEIDRSWHPKLAKYCHNLSIDLIDSPCDFEAVDLCVKAEMPLMKVASFDMVDVCLIDYISKASKALMFSTGMSTMLEIERAINICRANDNNNIIALQCTSLYPAPAYLANLSAMQTIRSAFDIIAGYSDHTQGDHIALASVAAGAQVVEKHYTLDRSMTGPDHQFSIEPNELQEMIQKIREVETASGDGLKNGPREMEMEMYNKARRSIYAKQNIRKGQIIKSDDLIIKRPNQGLHPSLIDQVIGTEAKANIDTDFPITSLDIKQ